MKEIKKKLFLISKLFFNLIAILTIILFIYYSFFYQPDKNETEFININQEETDISEKIEEEKNELELEKKNK